jgi:hypothetical protein
MAQSDLVRAVIIDAQIARLTDQLRDLQFQATSAHGAAMEDLVAARIERTEEQLQALRGVRDAAMAGART